MRPKRLLILELTSTPTADVGFFNRVHSTLMLMEILFQFERRTAITANIRTGVAVDTNMCGEFVLSFEAFAALRAFERTLSSMRVLGADVTIEITPLRELGVTVRAFVGLLARVMPMVEAEITQRDE